MRLNLIDALTTEERKPQWIVQDIIPVGTIVLVAGDAGVGKSVMNLAEGLHIALGRPFLGHATIQSRVLYFDEENSRPDVLAYLQRLWIGMGQPDPALLSQWFRLEHFSLGRTTWPESMMAASQDFQPSLIYVDTATSALSIQKEDDNAEAQKAIQQLRYVMRATRTNPAIKVLKHAKYHSGGGHGGGTTRRTIRGAKAWLGAVDQTMYHIRVQGRPRKDGLHSTILVPDKTRAYGLRGNIKITPTYTDTTPKGLILHGESLDASEDFLIHSDNS